MKSIGVHHRRITPVHPKANGCVERLNKTINKMFRCCEIEHRDWKDGLDEILFAYRNSVNSVTGKKPSELLFNRCIRTKIPSILDNLLTSSFSHVEAKYIMVVVSWLSISS